jgi:hypothetical protein
MNTPRRVFLMSVAAAGAAMATGAQAQAKPADEKDPQAVALGYVADAKRADAKKFPKYAAGQACSNCMFYQGKATDASAPCPMLAGKAVAGKGWCSAYAKKA